MEEKKTHAFTLKLDDELFLKVENNRGDIIKADYIRDILEMHFEELADNPDESRQNLKTRINNLVTENNNLTNEINNLKSTIINRDHILKVMEGRVSDLQNSNGFFISQIQLFSDQKRLSEPTKKLWFQFWK